MKLEIKGATIEHGGEEKIRKALAALAEDPHAPREVSVKFTLHIHNEFPKHLYKGKHEIVVHDEKAEEAARADGFGKFVPAADEEEVAE